MNNEPQLQSQDAVTPQPDQNSLSGDLFTCFEKVWDSQTVSEVRAAWISKLCPVQVFQFYEEVRSATIGPTLDTHPLEDVYKAVKIISQYTEMTYSYAKLLDQSAFGGQAKSEFSRALHSVFEKPSLAKLVGFTAGLNHFGLLEKYCKWSTASLWAWGLRQRELPPVPKFMENYRKFELLFCSTNWVNAMNRSNSLPSKDNQRFLAIFLKDLYNCKGAAAAVGPEFIKEALAKHKEILTTPKTPPTPISTEYNEDPLLTAITQCARTIFGSVPQKDLKVERRPPSRFPSLNSSANYRRDQGGAGGEILSQIEEASDPFYALQPEEGYFWGYAHHNAECIEVRTPYDPAIWIEAEILSETRALAKAASGLGVDAQVIPLSEPFKVRTITKGDCDMYHLARRWQKVIHSKMRKQLNCSLIGKPCDGVFLSKIFYESEHFDYSNKQGFFVSGDYESATDLLNPQLSLWAQNEISNRLRIPLEHQRVLNACLTEHNLYYGEKDENGNKITYKQTWGQLMGSPTSFPVLCLINLAATKMAYELYMKECLEKQSGGKVNYVDIPLEQLPMCVNGDDILFWCHNDRHYQIWKDVTANAGLKFSLGKNYTHRKYCIINSEMYRYRLTESLPFQKVPCINTRLLEGGNRSTVTSTHPLHVSDFDWLVKDKLFDSKKHLPRFASKINKAHDALRNLKISHQEKSNASEVWEDYASWYRTIEQRRSVLHRQAFENLSDRPERRPAQIHRGQLMEKILDERFSRTQFRKLKEFRVSLGHKIGQDSSFYLPQSLGGFGFPKGPEHRHTATDLRVASLAYSEPKMWKKTLSQWTPSLAKAGFMTTVSSELNFCSKALAIPKEVQIMEYQSHKQVDTGSIFELRCLAGFISPTNLCVGELEREVALKSRKVHSRPTQRLNAWISRLYNDQVKGPENKAALRSIAADLDEGKERMETIILDHFYKGWHIRESRPSPRF
nr:MAG: putative RNA-dependent RNA polymerase [Narnaviridae sp.]UJQ92925.1 MAG: putative RNA-dependent RNA polymerase [Narnaviridae sp.]